MKKKKSIPMEFVSGIGARKLTIFAASGSYYLFMSLVPIIMIICCILPYTPISQELVRKYVDIYFNEALAQIVRNIISAIFRSNSSTLTLSILLTVYSASASMRALMAGIDAAYHFKRKDNFIIYSLKAILYMIILFATLTLSLVILVYGGRILRLLKRYLPHVTFFNLLLSGSRYVILIFLLAVIFCLLYRLMPSKRIHWADHIIGAIFSAVMWSLFSYVFTLYLNISDKFGAYGSIGTIMVAMMWIYYCLLIFLIGGYLNSFIYDRKAAVEQNEQMEALAASSMNTEGKRSFFSRFGRKKDTDSSAE